MLFMTENGKYVHILKRKSNDNILYSKNSTQLIAYCGVSCSDKNAFIFDDCYSNFIRNDTGKLCSKCELYSNPNLVMTELKRIDK